MKSVTIYTKNYCPYCVKAKKLLEKKGAAFKEINVEESDPATIQALFSKTGFRTVPQIFIGDECIGGCDQLYELEADGSLNSKLGI